VLFPSNTYPNQCCTQCLAYGLALQPRARFLLLFGPRVGPVHRCGRPVSSCKKHTRECCNEYNPSSAAMSITILIAAEEGSYSLLRKMGCTHCGRGLYSSLRKMGYTHCCGRWVILIAAEDGYTHCCRRWVILIAAEDWLYSLLRQMGYTHCLAHGVARKPCTRCFLFGLHVGLVRLCGRPVSSCQKHPREWSVERGVVRSQGSGQLKGEWLIYLLFYCVLGMFCFLPSFCSIYFFLIADFIFWICDVWFLCLDA